MVRFKHIISAIDTHTSGEPTRIVLSGLPPIQGRTMAEKQQYMMDHLDHFRTLLMQEPRGHKDMFGAIITPPTTNRSQYGLLFMHNSGYVTMCGHATIGITKTLIEMGMIPAEEPETIVAFDTPAGLVDGHARIEGGVVVEASVSNVSSFLYAQDVEIELPGIGKVAVDISFGGNFFALVPAKAVGLALHPDNIPKLAQLGMMVKRAVNEKVKVQHPTEKQINKVELTEFYDKPEPSLPVSSNAIIFGDGQVDRSPCGTGISAAMAMLYGKGELSLNQEFQDASIIGTRFKGKLVRESRVGNHIAVDPVVSGGAYITGIQQFVMDPDDPVKYGFVVGGTASS
ncbi:MAG: proline racemase family protein [Methanothrix sp.]